MSLFPVWHFSLLWHFFFFKVKGSRPGKNVQLTENEIRGLCLKSREIFLSQPILLELEAPLKICGEFHVFCEPWTFANALWLCPSQRRDHERTLCFCINIGRIMQVYCCVLAMLLQTCRALMIQTCQCSSCFAFGASKELPSCLLLIPQDINN